MTPHRAVRSSAKVRKMINWLIGAQRRSITRDHDAARTSCSLYAGLRNSTSILWWIHTIFRAGTNYRVVLMTFKDWLFGKQRSLQQFISEDTCWQVSQFPVDTIIRLQKEVYCVFQQYWYQNWGALLYAKCARDQPLWHQYVVSYHFG